jgi:hypothetical protein
MTSLNSFSRRDIGAGVQVSVHETDLKDICAPAETMHAEGLLDEDED